MYWKDIGVTVDRVFAHTYAYNLIYGRPIYPLGQVYSHPPARQIVRFRELARAYGASGVSWWDWQEASHRAWLAVSRPAGVLSGYVPYEALATIRRRAVGDLVVWAQEHLVSAGYDIAVDGRFWRLTWQAVLAFQAAHGLTADGVIGPETWAALLRYAPVRVIWGDGNPRPAVAAGARAGARAARVLALPPPASAGAPAQRDELAGSPGAGAPSAGHPR
ncbi:MAG: peptidoglycan-binding protein [Solirubrobacterales bacterium]|nr:peptidoglycan-binding protein [Solirubrobacterales bacterium]